jgi:uncharacterized protein YktA (UPF0223 family)
MPGVAEILEKYRETAIARAVLIYASGGDYIRAAASLKELSGVFRFDETIAAEIARYEGYSPVAMFRNGTITNDTPAAALVPRTRAEANEILKMLYINNLDSADSPVIQNNYDKAYMEQIKRAYDNPSAETPFLDDYRQATTVIESKFFSYTAFDEYYANVSQSRKEEFFYNSKISWGNMLGSYRQLGTTRIKLGTDFDFEMSITNYYRSRYSGDPFYIGESQYRLTKNPTGAISGSIRNFTVNPDNGYIFFECTNDDPRYLDFEHAVILFAGTENGKTVFEGIVVTKHKESSYFSVQYTKIY